LGGSGRVAGGGGADLILRFQLERGGVRTNHCRMMKQRQQAHFSSMESKCDTTRWRDDIDQRRGGTREGKGMR
jgi:hypothetical protein